MAKQQITFSDVNDVSNAVDALGCRVFTATSPNGSLCIVTVTPVNVEPVKRTAEITKSRGKFQAPVKELVVWLQQSLIGGFQKPKITIGEDSWTIGLKVNKVMPKSEQAKSEKSNGSLVSI